MSELEARMKLIKDFSEIYLNSDEYKATEIDNIK